MAKHLKTKIIAGLNEIVSQHVFLPANSAPRARGVRYLTFIEGINAYCGVMNTAKEASHYGKHIIVRRAPEHKELFQLYTYHFPTHWSEACVANRELIKRAQRMAHDLEHAHTREALEWRLRFWHHYFTVFKGGEKPEPGMKPYSRFYQYTYVAIYRQLQAAKRQAAQTAAEQARLAEEISFVPISHTTTSHSPFGPATMGSTPFRPAPIRYRHSLTAHFHPSVFHPSS